MKTPFGFILAAGLAFPLVAFGDTFNWLNFTSTSSQDWSSGANWTGGSAPGLSDPGAMINFDPAALETTTSSGYISNSFTSNNDVGTVQLNRLNLLGASSATSTTRTIALTGGALDFRGANAAIVVNTGNAGSRPVKYTVANALTLNTDLLIDASGSTAGSSAVFSGGVSLGSSTLTLRSNSSAVGATSPGSLEVSGTIAGSGDIVVEGGFSSFASATGSGFTGNLKVSSGRLTLGSGLMTSSNVMSVANGATLALNNTNHTWAGLNDANGGGGVVGLTVNNARSITLAGAGSYSFSGAVDDRATGNSGSSAKINLVVTLGSGGIQVFSGTNTYTGTTVVNSGSLIVDGSLTSAVTVKNGATFGGYGGTSGTLLLESGSTFLFDLSDPVGESFSASTITINTGALFSLVGSRAVTLNTEVTVLSSISGTFGNLTDGATVIWDGVTWQADYDAGSLTLTAIAVSPVPEPSTYAMLAGLLAGAVVLGRRRIARCA